MERDGKAAQRAADHEQQVAANERKRKEAEAEKAQKAVERATNSTSP